MRLPWPLAWGVTGFTTACTIPPLFYYDLRGDPAGKHEVVRWWCRGVLSVCGATWSVTGLDKVPTDRPYVILSNHRSHVDGPTIAVALPHPFTFIIKRELAEIPIWGRAAKISGFIPVDRGRSEVARATMAAAVERIRSGTNVMLFPEGTRSETNALLPFKKGGFHLAIDAQVPVLPVALSGSRGILPKKKLAPQGGHVQVDICDPIDTAGLGPDDVPALVERTRTVIAAALKARDDLR